MSEFNIEVEGGSSVRLPTGGKYCPKDIIVTAKGGGSAGGGDIDALIDGTITEVSSGVTSIKDYTFYKRSSLTSISFPNVTSIGEKAFYDCDGIKDVYFPNSTSIGGSAFWGCSLLESASLPKATSLKGSTFASCSKLKSADLPSVTRTSTYDFQNCKALTNVNLPNATKIGANAFDTCSTLTSIELPNATEIGDYAFRYCYALANVNLPNATKIGNRAFDDCKALKSVNFPNVAAVSQYLFFGCYALESADFAKATRIDTYSFSACFSLKSVILRSETVCTLSATTAFNACSHILGTVDSTYNPNGDKDGYIYVPANLVDSYKSATNWSTYASQIVAIPGEESTKLPTPTIMVDIGDLYINDYGNATTATLYWSGNGTNWDYLTDFDLTTGETQHVVSYDTLVAWFDEYAGVTEGDGSLYLSVITHADGYESSERSNSDVVAL